MGETVASCILTEVFLLKPQIILRTEQYGNCNAHSVKARLRSFRSERHSHFYIKLNCNWSKLFSMLNIA